MSDVESELICRVLNRLDKTIKATAGGQFFSHQGSECKVPSYDELRRNTIDIPSFGSLASSVPDADECKGFVGG
jgi:hypothetical protein